MNARRLVAALLAVFALTACAAEPATPSEEPAHQVDIDALGDPTGTPAPAHGEPGHNHTTDHQP